MLLEIILIILGIMVIVGFTIFKVKKSKSITKFPMTANMPLVLNFYRKEFAGGYTIGTLNKITKCKNGTSRVELYPIDVEQGEEIPIPTIQSFIVKDEYIDSYGLSEISDFRQIIILTTRNPLLIPKRMRKTILGDYTTKAGQLAYLRAELGKMIPAGDESIAEIMKEYARGNLPKAELSRLKEVSQKYNELKITSPEQPGEQETKK